MQQAGRKNIVVQLSDRLLEKLSSSFWYAPASTSLSYQGNRLPRMQTEIIRQTPNNVSSVAGPVWLIGGAAGQSITGLEDYGLIMGSARAEHIDVSSGSGFVWGGRGADVFKLGYSVQTQKLTSTVLDASSEDEIEIGLNKTASQKEFNTAVTHAKGWFGSTVGKLSFFVETDAKFFVGGAFDDTISLLNAGSVNGGSGNDVLYGSFETDTLNGGDGDDTLIGGGGKDRLIGGKGKDVFFVFDGDTVVDTNADDTIIVSGLVTRYDSSPARVIYNLDNSAGQTKTKLAGDKDNDTLSGSGLGDTLTGNGGDDTFNIAGRDVVTDAGLGDVIFYFSANVDDRASVIARYGTTQAKLNFVFTLNDSKGAVTVNGWRFDDQISGSSKNDLCHGGNGNDTIEGAEGNDTLYGDAGDDFLSGGSGSNLLFGGAGNDALYVSSGLNLMRGGDGTDTLAGGTGSDSMYGDAGHDVLNGFAGNDQMWGGTGNDTLNGGIGRDTLHGDIGNDIVMGGDGNDLLYGDDGNDTLAGGPGNDTLTGGAGGDLFVFSITNNAYVATITDFASGTDKIDLSAFTLAGLSATAIRNAVTFRGGLITADFNNDGFLDVNVRLTSGTFNKATDIIAARL